MRNGAPVVLRSELYDLAVDPAEKHNLAHRRPHLAKAMDDRLRSLLGSTIGQETADKRARWNGARWTATEAGLRFALPVLHIRLWAGNDRAKKPKQPRVKQSRLHRLRAVMRTVNPPRVRMLVGRGTVRWYRETKNRRLVVDLQADVAQTAHVAVELPGGRTALELFLNDRPLFPADVAAGRFGLPLLVRLSPLDSTVRWVLTTTRTPLLFRGKHPRVSMWIRPQSWRRGFYNERKGKVEMRAFGPPVGRRPVQRASKRQVDRLLRRWGYVRSVRAGSNRSPK
jgi:hypothetical protein